MLGRDYTGLPGAFELRAFRQSIADKMSWFWYATPNQVIPAPGTPAEPQITIDQRSDFLALELMGFSDQDAGGVNFYTIELATSSSGRGYQSAPLHNLTVVGTAQRPHWFAVPILFHAGSSIALRLVPLVVGPVYNIRIVLGGVKVYKS